MILDVKSAHVECYEFLEDIVKQKEIHNSTQCSRNLRKLKWHFQHAEHHDLGILLSIPAITKYI